MTKIISAGLLMYHQNNTGIKVFLVHPGGPFFTNKDNGWWGIPKGLPDENEDLLNTAIREFEEETGLKPKGNYIPLGTVEQKGGKTVHAWAFENDNSDPVEIQCNTFTIEWPPRSGRFQDFPEVDKGDFFSIEEAEKKINSAQTEFLTRLMEYLKRDNK
jgi:predicted NUDIX family NTP pyrophosphohydrolase